VQVSHGTLHGKRTVLTNSSGAASFSGLSLSAAGHYTLTVAIKGHALKHALTIHAAASQTSSGGRSLI